MSEMSEKKSKLKSQFKLQPKDMGDEEHDDREENVEEETEMAAAEEVAFEKPLIRALNKSEISIRLSCLGKIATGDAYTYLKASITDMGLTDIRAIVNFKHLQFVDFSNNKLTIDSLQPVTELPYLLLLKADQNLLQSAALNKTKYLQVIIMNKNYLTSCHDVYQPNLSTLELGYNKIEEVTFEIPMPSLKCLDFKYNIIRELTNWDFPNLHSLYLAGNKIKKLDGIENLINLKILHLRNNPIAKLDNFHEEMQLIYLNLRNCKVKSLKQVKKLKMLPSLRTLIMKGTPYMGGTGKEEDQGDEDEEVRVQILAALPKLERINKAPVTDEERAEARELIMQQLEEAQNEEEEEEEEEIMEEGEKE